MASEDRHDRHRMRRRGIGARSLASQFGFTLALPTSTSSSSLATASPSNDPSRTPSPHVELHPTKHLKSQPKSQPARRKATAKASTLAAPPTEIATAASKPTRKRKRRTTSVAEQDSVPSAPQIPKPALPPTTQLDRASPEPEAEQNRKKRAPKTAQPVAHSVDNISKSRPPPKKKAGSRQRVPTPPQEPLQPRINAINETRHTTEPPSPIVPVTAPKRPRLESSTTQLQEPVGRIQTLHMRTVSVDQLHAPVKPPSPKIHPTARKPKPTSTKHPSPPPEPLDKRQELSLRSPNLPDPPPTRRIRSQHKGKLLSSNQTRPRLRATHDDWQKEDWFEASVPASLLQVQGTAPSRLKFRF